ncbi:FG-GAP-like repeat-containing protein [Catalinimonas sp. 4WD22]|uniref:FG-GAP-like repeat-containing protein n=1 Tax=Catalinimonas locisalis TaxID=3133978 RepID=UPI00310182F6
MKYIILLFISLCFSLSVYAQSPEICGNAIDDNGDGLIDCEDPQCGFLPQCDKETNCFNGIDDDGDGTIDYYDRDCSDNPANPNKYISNEAACTSFPANVSFEPEPAWDSDIQTSAALGMPSVADLDQDGYPEVISMNSETGWLYVLDGRTGSTLNQVRVKTGQLYAYPTVGDVDGDGFGEIFTIDLNGVIRAYEHDLTLKWTATSTFTGFGRHLALADFNHDGKAELYSVNEIWNAETGTLLLKGSHGSSMYPSANDWHQELNATPAAVDILPSPGLELAVGHIVYTVNITNTGGISGNSLTEAKNMNNAGLLPADYAGYYPADADWGGQTHSQTAVVDYNQDGNLDVLIGGANGGIDSITTAFFWDIANDAVKTFTVTKPGNNIPTLIRGTYSDLAGNNCDTGDECYWERGMGSISVADIDGDGQLEATFVSGSSLYALERDFTQKWVNHDDFWDSGSGITSLSLYDFDGDGSAEILYRDEIDLYVIDGTTGLPLTEYSGTFCSSQTQVEYPIIADVDGDGETEIILSCGEAENIFGSSPATSGTRTNGFIRAYKAAQGNGWAPTRKVWNQYAYYNVNINDDLSIPRYQQAHHQSLDANCPNTLPLNKYLSQSSLITPCGDPVFPAAKLDFEGEGLQIISTASCAENEIDVRLRFKNTGNKAVIEAIPISFYTGNPTATYSNTDESPYLTTINLNLNESLQATQILDTIITVQAIPGEYELFASFNDIGQNNSSNEAFYPLTELNGSIAECDDTPTLFSIMVVPQSFEVKAVKIRDNRNCPGNVTLNNGEVQVLAPDDTPFPTSNYSFTWTNIQTGQVVGTDALLTGLDSGTYQIVVENTDYGCLGLADTIKVERLEDWPDTQVITLEELQPVSSCVPGTADGVARVLINGQTADESEYDIEWEDEQQAGILAIGDTVSNLKPILYKVTVINKLTGCSSSETIDMTLDGPVMDYPTITVNTNCKSPNGSISAKPSTGYASDYGYMLIQLSPVQDTILIHNNGSFTGLDEGLYDLRMFDPVTKCGKYTDGIAIEVTKEINIDDLTVEITNPQTACNQPYNGQLQAVINNPSIYDFVWYRGTVTTGPTAEIVATDYITPDTLGTNLTDIYTVIATRLSSGCSVSQQIQLTENIPSANFSYAYSTYCQDSSNPLPEIHTLGGTFSSSPGLLIDANTGEIDLLASTPGVYTITNTIASAGACPASSHSFMLQIVTAEDASFSYAQSSYCKNEANPVANITGTPGGTFSSTSGLVFVDTTTGEIDLGNSISGTHEVTYTTSGSCPAMYTFDFTIHEAPVITSVSTSNTSCDGFDIDWDAVPGATDYLVEISEQSDFSNIIASSNIASTNYTFSGLISGQTYYYRVSSETDCGTITSTVESIITEGVPTQPANLLATAAFENGFTLNWDATEQATDYVVEIDDDPLFSSPEISNIITGTTFTASGLMSETSYSVRVTPRSTCGTGSSSEITAQTSSALLVSDSLALVALYYATDGDNWTRNDNWLTGPLDSWYGVTVSEWKNRVSRLSLHNNNLSGTIPSEIGELNSLSYLYMSENRLEGEIPVKLAQLTNLGELNLSYNNLEGLIPKELAALKLLVNLGLSYNQFSGELPKEILNIFVENDSEFDSLAIEGNHLAKLPVYPEGIGPSFMHSASINKLTFDDILPNLTYFDSYLGKAYAPQRAIGVDASLYLDEGDSYTIDLGIDEEITDNQYVWFKDDVAFDTTNVNYYTFSSLTIQDEGRYTCKVTNAGAPDLTLYSYPVTIYVSPENEEPTLSVSASKNCIDQEISFTANGRNGYETYRWFIRRDTGYSIILSDSITTSPTLVHSLDQEGDYTVRLTLTNPYLDDTVLVDHFSIKPSPEVSLLASMNLNTDSLMLTAIEGYAADTLTFEWYKTEGQEHISIGSKNTLWIKEGGTYSVSVINPAGCETEAEIFVIDTRPETQTITFDTIPDKVYGESFELSATASSGLAVTYEVIAGQEFVSISDQTVSILGVGSVTIKASQSGNGEYLAAETVSQSFNISKAPQQINFTAIPDMLLEEGSFSLEASSSAGLPLTFSFNGPIVLSGKSVSLIDTGKVTITASQEGNDHYLPAASVYHTFIIGQEKIIEKDTLHQLSIRIDTEANNTFPLKLSLFKKQDGVYKLINQERMFTTSLSYENLAEGEYTLKIKAEQGPFLPTYLGQYLLLSEAERVSLTQDTEVSLRPISIPEVLKEIGITLRGRFIQSAQASNGRLMISQEALDGIPVVGLTIYLIDNQDQNLVATTSTDGDGKFMFTNLSPGSYSIKADHKALPMDASASFEVAQQSLELTVVAGEEISIVAKEEVEGEVTAFEDEIRQQLRFYPNPVEDMLYLQIPSSLIGGELKIFDTHGKLVFTAAVNHTKINCSLSHLSSGHYQLQIAHQGKTYALKILKR